MGGEGGWVGGREGGSRVNKLGGREEVQHCQSRMDYI